MVWYSMVYSQRNFEILVGEAPCYVLFRFIRRLRGYVRPWLDYLTAQNWLSHNAAVLYQSASLKTFKVH
jgi:hypothetical protein